MLTMEKTLQNNVHLATRESLKINQETAPYPLPHGGLPQRQRTTFHIQMVRARLSGWGCVENLRFSRALKWLLVIVAGLPDLSKILRQYSTRSVLIDHEVPEFQRCRAK